MQNQANPSRQYTDYYGFQGNNNPYNTNNKNSSHYQSNNSHRQTPVTIPPPTFSPYQYNTQVTQGSNDHSRISLIRDQSIEESLEELAHFNRLINGPDPNLQVKPDL